MAGWRVNLQRQSLVSLLFSGKAGIAPIKRTQPQLDALILACISS